MTSAELDQRFAELLDGVESEPVVPVTEADQQVAERPEPTVYTTKLAQCALGRINTSFGFQR